MSMRILFPWDLVWCLIGRSSNEEKVWRFMVPLFRNETSQKRYSGRTKGDVGCDRMLFAIHSDMCLIKCNENLNEWFWTRVKRIQIHEFPMNFPICVIMWLMFGCISSTETHLVCGETSICLLCFASMLSLVLVAKTEYTSWLYQRGVDFVTPQNMKYKRSHCGLVDDVLRCRMCPYILCKQFY